MTTIQLVPGALTFEQVKAILNGPVTVTFKSSVKKKLEKSRALVLQKAAGKQAIYGVNTGFGSMAGVRIAKAELPKLQRNLVLSHSTGVGPPLSHNIVRLSMVLKLNSLAQGYSGVDPSVFEMLHTFVNRDLIPQVPSKGSVGASGDLAPLAHIAAAMIGEGAFLQGDDVQPAKKVLEREGLSELILGPKDGLALINGTQVSTAIALCALAKTENLFKTALVTGALSVDAASGSDGPFDDKIQSVRGHAGGQDVAKILRGLLAGSGIRESHRDADRVQDAYSLRCQPQVMGAVRDTMRHVEQTLLVEANGVSDNPLVFVREKMIISGGNFHGEAVALAADNLACAIAEIGALSERRIALLIDHHMSGAPPYMTHNSGTNSGFMCAQITAASLASENKSLAHPASVDSIPTGANQEDHVSMATFAARRLFDMVKNIESILAIELLTACRGIELKRPLGTSDTLERVIQTLRGVVPVRGDDHFLSTDIEGASQLIACGKIATFI